ncbi:MAG: hypothetical protein A3H98_06815 [Bacteroidetes bacterium RIFCSPLOWO2_02_FULL_36_8]|nr:MAG: hypothetical protein A3H98_06815 [Bacteroidetes bacterium RIFCSPLOWO2_02_FULL_36_8]
MANYEDDMLILIETSSGSPIHVYFDIEFPHKAKGDTSCNGPKYDMGGSAALISGSPQPDDQNWSTCENSPVDFQGRTAALVAGKYYVLRTREENFYKIYIEQILYNGTTPVGVKMTRVAMKK